MIESDQLPPGYLKKKLADGSKLYVAQIGNRVLRCSISRTARVALGYATQVRDRYRRLKESAKAEATPCA